MLQELEDERRADLVGRVGYTEVKEGEVDLDGIACYHLELVRVAQVLNTLGDFGDHASINLNRYNFLATLKQRRSEVTSARTDLQYDIRWFNARLLYDLLHHEWVFQYVLSETLVKGEIIALLDRASMDQLLAFSISAFDHLFLCFILI